MCGWDTRGSFKKSGSVQADSPSSSLAGVDKTRTPSHQAPQRQLRTRHTWPPSSIENQHSSPNLDSGLMSVLLGFRGVGERLGRIFWVLLLAGLVVTFTI